MKLSRQQELITVGVLIVYLAFTPGFQIIRDILATPIGRVAFLAAIVYVFKFVSASVALLLLVGYMRCVKMNIWEGADDSSMKTSDPTVAEYKCDTGYTYSPADGKCKDSKGDLKEATVICQTGWAYDEATKKCKSASSMTEPVVMTVPPPLPSATPAMATAASATTTGSVTSPTMPMTTPSTIPPAAMAAEAAMGGVQSAEGFANSYSPF